MIQSGVSHHRRWENAYQQCLLCGSGVRWNQDFLQLYTIHIILLTWIKTHWPGTVKCACKPSYPEGWDRKIFSSRPENLAWQQSQIWDIIAKFEFKRIITYTFIAVHTTHIFSQSRWIENGQDTHVGVVIYFLWSTRVGSEIFPWSIYCSKYFTWID